MTRPASFLPDVALFAHIACRKEADLDLAQAALALAEPEYPGLDIGHYLHVLDELAAGMRPQVTGVRDSASQAASLVNHLVHDQGFRGNLAEYQDPRNSFLNEVLDRRLGIPISLSVVMIEVARRLRVPLFGVSFPGHFILRGGRPEEAPVYIDPFGARLLGPGELRELLHQAVRERREPRPDELKVASKAAILTRMLANLRNIYTQKRDVERLRLVVARLKAMEVMSRGGVPPAPLLQ